MTSAAHSLTILAKNGLHVSPVHRLGRIWAAFFEPKCSKNGSRGCLWGSLGCFGDGRVGSVGSAGRRWAESRKKTPGDHFFGIQNAPSLVSFLIKIEGTNYADKIS